MPCALSSVVTVPERQAAASHTESQVEAAWKEARDVRAQADSLREHVERAHADLVSAQGSAARSEEARRVAEETRRAVEEARREAEEARREAEASSDAAHKAKTEAEANLEEARRDAEEARRMVVASSDAAHKAKVEAEANLDEARREVEEARREAVAFSDATQKVKADAEANVEVLRQALSAREAHVEEMGKVIMRADDARMAAEVAQAENQQAFFVAREDARRASGGKNDAEQALEASAHQIGHLQESLHGLEARVGEATESAQKQQVVIEEQRSALTDAHEKLSKLERSLRTATTELDGEPLDSTQQSTRACPA